MSLSNKLRSRLSDLPTVESLSPAQIIARRNQSPPRLYQSVPGDGETTEEENDGKEAINIVNIRSRAISSASSASSPPMSPSSMQLSAKGLARAESGLARSGSSLARSDSIRRAQPDSGAVRPASRSDSIRSASPEPTGGLTRSDSIRRAQPDSGAVRPASRSDSIRSASPEPTGGLTRSATLARSESGVAKGLARQSTGLQKQQSGLQRQSIKGERQGSFDLLPGGNASRGSLLPRFDSLKSDSRRSSSKAGGTLLQKSAPPQQQQRRGSVDAAIAALAQATDVFDFGDSTAATRWQPQHRPWSPKKEQLAAGEVASIENLKPPADWKKNIKSSISNQLERKKARLQYVASVAAMIGLFFSLLENRQCLNSCTESGQTNICSAPPVPASTCASSSAILKPLGSVATFFFIISLHSYYKTCALLTAFYNHIGYNEPIDLNSLYDTGLLGQYIIEMVIAAIHLFPGVSFKVNFSLQSQVVSYRIEDLLCIVMFLRVFQLWRCYTEYYYLRHSVKHVASKLYNTPMSHAFVMKATLDSNPFSLIGLSIVLFIGVTAFTTQVAEAPVQYFLPSSYWNCCWFIVVTMATVGYGDYTPVTYVGRFVAVIAMTFGTITVAILTAAVSNNLAMTSNENSATRFLYEVQWGERRQEIAAVLLQRWFKAGFKCQNPRYRAAAKQQMSLRRKKAYWDLSEPHIGRQLTTVVGMLRDLQTTIKSATSKIETTVESRERLIRRLQQAANSSSSKLIQCPQCMLEFRAQVKQEDADLIPSDRAALGGATKSLVKNKKDLVQVLHALALLESKQKNHSTELCIKLQEVKDEATEAVMKIVKQEEDEIRKKREKEREMGIFYEEEDEYKEQGDEEEEEMVEEDEQSSTRTKSVSG